MQTQPRAIRTKLLAVLAALLLAMLVLGCAGTAGVNTGSTPRWACPSPIPKLYGPDGPVKQIIQHAQPTTIPSGPVTYTTETIYYAIWEQEYGALASEPPYPSPTPYALIGTNYVFGQRIEVGPVHVLVSGRSEALQPDGMQLYFIDIAWVNHSLVPLPISYAEHVRLRAITDPNGAVISAASWGVSADSLRLAGLADLPNSIPTGASSVSIPVLAPPGSPKVIDVQFVGQPGYMPPMPSATTLAGKPTSTPIVLGPTSTTIPNNGLAERRVDDGVLLVQWTDAVWRAPGAPVCDSAGTLTDWGTTDGVWGDRVPLSGVAAPPGAARVVQIAMNQVGKPYVWGAKGPERFDCSGLMSWSYAQIGVPIPNGTANQWPAMAPVPTDQLQAGDLVFFDISGTGGIDHVGMLVGDVNGDGTMDMVHAANPQLGVRMEYSVFTSAYYVARIRGYRTARTA